MQQEMNRQKQRKREKGKEAKKPYSGKQRIWFRSNILLLIQEHNEMFLKTLRPGSVQGECSIANI